MKNRPVFLAVCAIAKNEGKYFDEWIEYHKSVGVEKFYIYDNESTDNTREILSKYPFIEYHFIPGIKQQLNAYNDCIKKHKRDTEWIAFIDLDEFIVPQTFDNIPDFIKSVHKTDLIEINWIVYGSSGHKTYSPVPVMQRFTKHSTPDHPVNNCVKSIVNPRRVFRFFSSHSPTLFCGRRTDSDGLKVRPNSFWTRSRKYDKIKINHYAVKSFEEFCEKQLRGDALFGDDRHRKLEYFTRNDINEVSDE